MASPSPSPRRKTATSNFGTGKRESHDASAFYERFDVPVISDRAIVNPPAAEDEIFCGDARNMPNDEVAPNSVALVVTSPPYFAGKEYEEALGEGHIPDSYKQYLQMLRDVFANCVDKLEDGGRIAVNVANLGRRPYRSLSADVINILQDDLKLLLRGEVIWRKAQGASGSCAWGSFQSPVNPVLRDLTERVIIASKGRFDRAISRTQRAGMNRPVNVSLFKDDFMDWTTDIWDIPPESATRVNHPAPFPVELPQRLIDLYTFEGDLVLDPFMGSGTTAIAAVKTGRSYVGYDTDPAYVDNAKLRIKEATTKTASANPAQRPSFGATRPVLDHDADFYSQAIGNGLAAKEVALHTLQQCGFSDITTKARLSVGIEVDFRARGNAEEDFIFLVAGSLTSNRGGLKRSDVLWRCLGKATAIAASEPNSRVVLLTTAMPERSSANFKAMDASLDGPVFDVIDLFDAASREVLGQYAPAPGSRKAKAKAAKRPKAKPSPSSVNTTAKAASKRKAGPRPKRTAT
jgi:DNA modification methylase